MEKIKDFMNVQKEEIVEDSVVKTYSM